MEADIKEIVLVRGLSRQQRHWGRFVEELQKRFPNTHIALVDLPGAGQLRDITPPPSITQYVPYLAAQLQKAKGRRVMVSISLGGMVALEWHRQKPDAFSDIFLINSSASGLSPLHKRLSIYAFQKFVRAVGLRSVSARERYILDVASNSAAVRDATVGEWTKIQEEEPILVSSIFRQFWAAARFRFAPLKGRFHVIYSEMDRLCDPSCSLALATALSASVVSHPTAGHELSLDDPEWLAEQIRNQIDKVP